MTTPFRQGLNKVYLPNIVFKMIRAPNLQPNQVAFKVPPSCNKFDIHSYITNIYGVEVQEVRTMNYATEHRKARGGSMEVKTPSYKKAIITLNETFEWPKSPEWCELEQEQGKLGSKIAGRKMKGWRFRGTAEERSKMKILNEKIQAKMEAEQKQK